MAQKKKTYTSNIETKKYFKSPLFLIVAILITLIPIALIARMIMAGVGVVLAVGLIYAIISTVYAWMVFSGKCEIKKVKKFCRIISFTRFLNTLITIAFIGAAAILAIGLIIGAATASSGLYDFADTLEYQVKPIVEQMTVSGEEFDEYVVSYADILTPGRMIGKGIWLGVNDVADLRIFMHRWFVVGSYLLVALDAAIPLARGNFMVFALIVTAILALVATAMCFLNNALKKAVRQLLTLSTGINGFKKSHRFALCAGGTVLILVGLVMVFLDPILSAVPLILGAVLYVFAMMFGDVKYEKREEEKTFAEANEIAEAAKITVTDY